MGRVRLLLGYEKGVDRMFRVFRSVRIFVVATFITTGVSAQDVLYVDATASSGGDGLAWQSAFDDLADALAATETMPDVSEIWVAAGVYLPGEPDETEATFQLRQGLAIYGGFAGDEDDLDQRDPAINVTVLSGDLGQDDEYGDPVWHVGWNRHTANSAHVVTGSGCDATAVLDGFTIEAGATGANGTPAGAPQMYGSGLYNVNGSPTIRHCTFKRNLAAFAHGGAVYNMDSSPTFEHCEFIQNWVHLGHGGAIANRGNSAVTVTDSTFVENRSVGSSPAAAGGGIAHQSDGPLVIERCKFIGNISENFFPTGGDYGGYGGGVYHFSGGLTVASSTFEDNWSNAGGGLFTWNNATIINSVFNGNEAPEYSTSFGGWGGFGGAIGGSSFAGMTVAVANSTIVNNTAHEGGGLRVVNNADADVANSIFWHNSDGNGMIGPSQIRGGGASYSCIENMLVGEAGEDPPDPEKFPNCIDGDPLFIDLADGDVALSAGSPCIDAADNTALPIEIESDIAGDLRFVDDPDTADTGFGQPPIVDIGAYEHQVQPEVPGDVTGDGVVNVSDLLMLLGAWGPCAPACDGDLNGDGMIGVEDLLTLLANWG